MVDKISNLERYRAERKQQVDARRQSIIEAAKQLFLEKGLENSSMRDIADKAHINRVTLYRYFSDRHPLAFEVAAIMMNEITTTASQDVAPEVTGLDAIRALFINMIRRFDSLQEAYRYLGMFDQIYAREYPSEELGQWYKALIFEELFATTNISGASLDDEQFAQIIMMGNTIHSFLQKLAARGDLLAAEQGVPIKTQLAHFEVMINHYWVRLLDES